MLCNLPNQRRLAFDFMQDELARAPGFTSQSNKLLPVTLSDLSWSKSGRASGASSPSSVGSMEIKLAKGTLRVAGNVDVVVLRTAIERLVG
jgi:hypothetical protein